MVHLDFKTKDNGMPVLSKRDIEELSEIIISDYKPDMIKNPKAVDVEHFLEFYAGLEMDYKDLTHNKSILGMMVFNDCCIPVYDSDNNKAKRIQVDEKTILIDNSLLNYDQLRRGRFTIAHEISHWFLHRQIYTVNKNQLSLFDNISEEKQPTIKCRTVDIETSGRKQLISDNDWMEWQADYMASTLLMPKTTFTKIVKEKFKSAGIENGFYEIGTDFESDIWAEDLTHELSNIFDVSVRAAKIRITNLNFIRDRQDSQQFFLM